LFSETDFQAPKSREQLDVLRVLAGRCENAPSEKNSKINRIQTEESQI